MTDTWVVTTYFNPCRYATRYANFVAFLKGMEAVGANVLIVELTEGASEVLPHVGGQVHVLGFNGNAAIWQKERLINLARVRLPPSCTKIVWADADILFEDPQWLFKTSAMLETKMVVQPFSHAVNLSRSGHTDGDVAGGDEVESFSSVFARSPEPAQKYTFKSHGHTGYAWAARRELLQTTGLYDACMTGSGDHLMAHAFSGTVDSACVSTTLGGGAHARHFHAWAARAGRFVDGRLGAIEGRVFHLWHGRTEDRRYHERNQTFKRFSFDPERDLQATESGLWEWAGSAAEIKAWSHDLFASRAEDGPSAHDTV